MTGILNTGSWFRFLSRYAISLVFIFLFPAGIEATHIVGGGFSMRSEGNFQYTIQLTLYFDEINGSQGALDNSVVFSVFRKSDNSLVETIPVFLDTENQQIIDYVGSACGTLGNPVKTRVLLYRILHTFSPSNYNQAAGYYIVWERCCRNQGITNLRFPGQQGQTFFMEFPPVISNPGGQLFENDSPVMKPVANNLFCINQTSSLDFSANDLDGDSLVWDLVPPVRSNIADTIDPRPGIAAPAPYPPVVWQTGYSDNNQIPGNPGLQVNPKTGILTLKPSRLGLFVFAVRCSEFRNGKKIGEVRREFQQVVIDCPANTPPRISLPNPVSGGLLGNNDTLYVSNSSQNRTCITVKVNDLQPNQRLTIRAVPINFTPVAPITGDTVKVVSTNDTARLSFCLPACVGSSVQNPFRLRILAFDNGCAGSLYDTLDIFIVLTVPFQPVPKININLADSVLILNGGESIAFAVETDVLPGQTNQLRAEGKNKRQVSFSLPSLGMRFPSASGVGPLSRVFSWTAPCSPPPNQPLTVWFIANSNFCNQPISLSRPVRFTVVPPLSGVKIRLASRDSLEKNVTWKAPAGQTISDTLIARHPQNAEVSILSLNPGSALSASGLSFSTQTGPSPLRLPLIWTPPCSGENNFPAVFRFVSRTSLCNTFAFDTLTLRLESPGKGTPNPRLVTLLTPGLKDGANDKISLSYLGVETGCGVVFEGFEIYNRWGSRVFSTRDENFSWPTDDSERGTYFYSLRISGRFWRGWLQLVD